jgi:hypothetical protein
MAKRKKNKTTLEKLLLTLGIAFTIILGGIKIFFNNGSWLKVFSPIFIVFIILFIMNLLKSAVKKI